VGGCYGKTHEYLVSTVDVNKFGSAVNDAAPVITNEEEVGQIRWSEPQRRRAMHVQLLTFSRSTGIQS
jgi:hypothetical protein